MKDPNAWLLVEEYEHELPRDPRQVSESLLQKNYFPLQSNQKTEVPPSLSSETLSYDTAQELADEFKNKRVDQSGLKVYGYGSMTYRMSRFDFNTRISGIPHPVAYAALVRQIELNWPNILNKLSKSHNKLPPHLHSDGRLFVMGGYDEGSPRENEPSFRDLHRAEFVVRTDIRHFYPSIYTHALEWAAIGKSESKQRLSGNKSHSNWGAQLDLHARACNRNQTQGLAIGPGTSSLLADFILAEVDQRLVVDGFQAFTRHIDDYKFYAQSSTEAESFLRSLESHLLEFELHLNPKKTSVNHVNQAADSPWILGIHSAAAATSPSTSGFNHFLDYLASAAQRDPGSSVFRFGLPVLLNEKPDVVNHPRNRNSVLRVIHQRPNLASLLSRVWPSDTLMSDSETYVLNSMLKRAITRRQTDLVTWIIHTFIQHQVTPDSEICMQLAQNLDPLPVALAYKAGFLNLQVLTQALLEKTSQHDPSGNAVPDLHEADSLWLLIYELFANSELPNFLQHETVTAGYAQMVRNGVSFVNLDKRPRIEEPSFLD